MGSYYHIDLNQEVVHPPQHGSRMKISLIIIPSWSELKASTVDLCCAAQSGSNVAFEHV